MSHTLRGTVPYSHEYHAGLNESDVLDAARHAVRIVTREAQCEPITQPHLVGTEHTPDYIIYTYECETTKPVLDNEQ